MTTQLQAMVDTDQEKRKLALFNLGKLARQGLNEPGKRLIFDKEEVILAAGKEALELGLLFGTERMSMQEEETDVLCFPHLLLQEFAAAKYVSELDKAELEVLFPSWESIRQHEEVIKFALHLTDQPEVLTDLILQRLCFGRSERDDDIWSRLQWIEKELPEVKECIHRYICFKPSYEIRTVPERVYIFEELSIKAVIYTVGTSTGSTEECKYSFSSNLSYSGGTYIVRMCDQLMWLLKLMELMRKHHEIRIVRVEYKSRSIFVTDDAECGDKLIAKMNDGNGESLIHSNEDLIAVLKVIQEIGKQQQVSFTDFSMKDITMGDNNEDPVLILLRPLLDYIWLRQFFPNLRMRNVNIDASNRDTNSGEGENTEGDVKERENTDDDVKERENTEGDVKERKKTDDDVKERENTEGDVKERENTDDDIKERENTDDDVTERENTDDDVHHSRGSYSSPEDDEITQLSKNVKFDINTKLVSIQHCTLSQCVYKHIAQQLIHCTQLEKLQLDRTPGVPVELGEVLSTMTSLKHFSISESHMTSDVSRAVMSGLFHCCHLEKLHLHTAELTGCLVKFLGEGRGHPGFPSLGELHLNNTKLRAADVQSLGDTLREGRLPQLTDLQLKNNELNTIEKTVEQFLQTCVSDIKHRDLILCCDYNNFSAEFIVRMKSLCQGSRIRLIF